MKELTTEEKARKYDEALTKARNIVNSINVGIIGKDSFEAVFPELKESESERIRKELLAWLKSRDGQTLPIDRYNAAITWLEKQGENSVCKVRIGEIYKCIASPRYTCFRKGDIYHVKDNFVAELINTCSGCFVLLEKQGEQKPTDKVEPKFKVGDTIYYNSFGEVKSMVVANVVTDSIDNPMYEDENGSAVFEKDLVEQNPTWSEEDEEYMKSLLDIINGTPSLTPSEVECHKDWLKSLRPQNTWKPSEGQMTALRRMKNAIGGEGEIYEPLNSLYEDLKKLREE